MQSRTRCFDAARGFYHPGDIHANGCRIWKNYDNAKNSFIWYSKKKGTFFCSDRVVLDNVPDWCWDNVELFCSFQMATYEGALAPEMSGGIFCPWDNQDVSANLQLRTGDMWYKWMGDLKLTQCKRQLTEVEAELDSFKRQRVHGPAAWLGSFPPPPPPPPPVQAATQAQSASAAQSASPATAAWLDDPKAAGASTDAPAADPGASHAPPAADPGASHGPAAADVPGSSTDGPAAAPGASDEPDDDSWTGYTWHGSSWEGYTWDGEEWQPPVPERGSDSQKQERTGCLDLFVFGFVSLMFFFYCLVLLFLLVLLLVVVGAVGAVVVVVVMVVEVMVVVVHGGPGGGGGGVVLVLVLVLVVHGGAGGGGAGGGIYCWWCWWGWWWCWWWCMMAAVIRCCCSCLVLLLLVAALFLLLGLLLLVI